MAEIESESRFIWKFILNLLMTPVTLAKVISGKKKPKELLQPLIDIGKFIIQPKFSITIIGINILLFILSHFFTESFFASLLLYPNDIFNSRFHTLITAGFLHANGVHLFGNMLGIFVFGRVVERKFKRSMAAFIYFFAMIVSGVFSSLVHVFVIGDNAPGLGASGALMGLVATAILIEPFYLVHEFIMPLPVMIVGWLTIYADLAGVLNPVEDGIGHLAHIGGFFSIVLMMYMFNFKEKKQMRKGLMINILSLIAAFLLFYYFGM